MHTYRYQMKRPNGEVVVGQLKADNQAVAMQQIREMGGAVLDLTTVEQGGNAQAKAGGIQIFNRIGSKDLLAFTRQLGVMSKAGIGLTAALESITDQLKNPRMQTVVRALKRDVEAGCQFSETMQRFPRVFSLLYVNMVRASELSGTFGHMLGRIAQYLTQQAQTRRQVTGAMIYPAIIVLMAIITTVFMLTFVLPQFMILFEGKEEILPLPTKMLMAMSASLTRFWYLYIVAAGGVAAGFIYFIRTKTGRDLWDLAKSSRDSATPCTSRAACGPWVNSSTPASRCSIRSRLRRRSPATCTMPASGTASMPPSERDNASHRRFPRPATSRSACAR